MELNLIINIFGSVKNHFFDTLTFCFQMIVMGRI